MNYYNLQEFTLQVPNPIQISAKLEHNLSKSKSLNMDKHYPAPATTLIA